ncbi:MAG TPA: hypothetical protein VGK19_14415 [Capsulimonadaceae bacterium]|jgi:hypothetical protein
MKLLDYATNVVVTGSVLTATTTAAIAVASKRETGSMFAALNQIMHIVDGDEIDHGSAFSPRNTLFGVAVSASAMFGWAAIHEALRGCCKATNPIAAAVATTTLAAVIDYAVVPPRYTPGIEKVLSKGAVVAIYGVMCASLALLGGRNKNS